MQGTTCPDIENVFDFWNFPYLINSLTSKCLKFLFKYWIYLRSWYMIISNPFKKFSRAIYLKCILIALRDTKLIVYGNSILKPFLRYGERHHWLDGRESEWTLGVGDGQGGLACCNTWGREESDMTEWLNWTEPQYFKKNNDLLSVIFEISRKVHESTHL